MITCHKAMISRPGKFLIVPKILPLKYFLVLDSWSLHSHTKIIIEIYRVLKKENTVKSTTFKKNIIKIVISSSLKVYLAVIENKIENILNVLVRTIV